MATATAMNGAEMFERFDQDARAAIAKAKEEASRAGRTQIGTEHLLLGLMHKPGDATDVLEAVQADPADVRAALPQVEAARAEAEQTPEPPEPAEAEPEPVVPAAAYDMRLSRNARRALDRAMRTAHRFRHEHVSSGHLLLSVIEQPDSGAAQALKVAGIHVGTLRTDILKQLTEAPAPARPASPAAASAPMPAPGEE
jgi:ATP-dependent Clp protease ATP-binding subunit ClpA